jgi:hypothetical protein
MSTIERLLGTKSIVFGLENREYESGCFVALTTWHHLSAKVGTYFADKCGFSVSIVRSRTLATNFKSLKKARLTHKVDDLTAICELVV